MILLFKITLPLIPSHPREGKINLGNSPIFVDFYFVVTTTLGLKPGSGLSELKNPLL